MNCPCAGQCRKPISHSQPTVNHIDLPRFARKVGDKEPASFTAQDRRAMDLFKP